jgi:hypothetical protein
MRYVPSLEDQKAYLATAKRLYRMTKPRSTTIIEYIEDPQDDWFIYEVKLIKKTGDWKYCNMLIQKDLCHFLSSDKNDGWTQETLI